MRVIDKSVLRILFVFPYFGVTWGMLLPKLAVIIIFQEVPLADSVDKWVSKSLIIPIFKNAHSGKTNNREKILLPLPVL